MIMKKHIYDIENVLRTWDVPAEQRKADFLEFLYQHYKPANHCFTGLYERFKEDLAQVVRDSGSQAWESAVSQIDV